MSLPAIIDEAAQEEGNTSEEEVQEEDKSPSAVLEEEVTKLEVNEIEEDEIASEEAREETETEGEVFIKEQDEGTEFGSEKSECGTGNEESASSKGTIFPPLSDANKFEDSASPLEMYIYNMFDFRINSS